jgi:hypothetical protein
MEINHQEAELLLTLLESMQFVAGKNCENARLVVGLYDKIKGISDAGSNSSSSQGNIE